MLAVLQRVGPSRVEVDGETIGAIKRGLLVYLGVEKGDGANDLGYMSRKTLGLRIFEDDAGKMNLNVRDVAGQILVISQFTLAGDIRKGNRPSFNTAAPPEIAEPLYKKYVSTLKEASVDVATGRFRANMQVYAQVDGPVTIIASSRN